MKTLTYRSWILNDLNYLNIKHASNNKEYNVLHDAESSVFADLKLDFRNRPFVDYAIKQPLNFLDLDSKVLLEANRCYFSANSLFLERRSFRIN